MARLVAASWVGHLSSNMAGDCIHGKNMKKNHVSLSGFCSYTYLICHAFNTQTIFAEKHGKKVVCRMDK